MRRAWNSTSRSSSARWRSQIESGLRPSLQIAVDFRGELVFERALGDGATVDSTYVLWSSTKPLVAVALLQLVEEGRAALDDRVAKHFPEFGKLGKERCTLLHLLTHRGGFPDSKPATRAELLRISRDWQASLEFVCNMEAPWEPGTDRGYHQLSGWFVVGELVQRLDGRPLAEALNARVLEPLGVPRDGFCLGRPQDLAAPPLTVRTRDAKAAPTEREADFWSDPARTRPAFPARSASRARARSPRSTARCSTAGGGSTGDPLARDGAHGHLPARGGVPRSHDAARHALGAGHAPEARAAAVDDCGTRATPGTFGHGGHFMVNTGWGDPGRNVAAAILSNGLAEPVAGMRAVCALSDAIHAAIDRATGAWRAS